ncbi:MAG TPA: DNA-formamidopyrimidine glycosylase family protein [Verrucomicrobiae bacterium]|nr:DNA-formamidopyrimidine glycosylase family protein [Verrucomicrobiae bacterium]
MPELPDVENDRRLLDRQARRKIIRAVEVVDDRALRKLSPAEFKRRTVGRRIVSSRRHGKHLLVALDKGGWITLHFGMTGALLPRASQGEAPAFTRLRLELSGGGSLYYTDPRRLGHIGLAEDADQFIAAEKLGPDALDPKLTAARFRTLVEAARGNAKSVLMDQSRIAGIGNTYGDEILFQARLHPELPIRHLDAGDVTRLYRAMRRVLKEAITRGAGSENFVDHLPASFLLRHRHPGGRCPRCGGPIALLRIAGRAAYYCPHCQPLA